MTTVHFSELKRPAVDEVKNNPRVSSGCSTDAIAEFALHIGCVGLFHPLFVTRDLVIVAGSRRHRAIEWLAYAFGVDGYREVAPEIEEMLVHYAIRKDDIAKIRLRTAQLVAAVPIRYVTAEIAAGVAIADNVQRVELTSYEVARYINHLATDKESGIASGIDIARLLGKSRGFVSRKLTTFRRATDELRAAWRDGLAESEAYELAQLSPATQRRALAGEVPRRGPANRPPIDRIRYVVHSAADRWVGKEISEYERGVLDSLRWAAGEDPASRLGEVIVQLEDPS